MEHLPEVIARVVPVIAREANPRLQRIFTLWMLRYLEKVGVKSEVQQLAVLTELEAKKMLETTIEEFKEKLLLQGREEGREEGRRQQAAEMVLDLLADRFNEVPPTARERLGTMSVERLKRVSRRIATMGSIEDLELEAEQPE